MVLDPSFLQDVNVSILPRTDNAYDLGSSSLRWRDAWISREVRANVVRPISDFVIARGYNLLTMAPYVDNALGFRRPYKVERWDGTAWVDVTNAAEWGYLTDGKPSTYIALIGFAYETDKARIRLYYDFGGRWVSAGQLLALTVGHMPRITYVKVEHADDAEFTTNVEILKEVTTAIGVFDGTVLIPTALFWRRYLRIEIAAERDPGTTWGLNLHELAYYSPGLWGGARLVGSMIPIDWDHNRNVTVGGYLDAGSLRIGGTEVVDSARLLKNVRVASLSKGLTAVTVTETTATLKQELGPDSGFFGFLYVEGIRVTASNPVGSTTTLYFQVRALLDDGCLPSDTLVLTDRGAVPISEVKVGDYVYSFSIKDGKFVKRRVLNVIPRGVRPVYRLTTGCRVIEATPNHPFLAVFQNGKERLFYWKRLDELKVGWDIVVSNVIDDGEPYKLPEVPRARTSKKPTIPEYTTEDFMRIVGFFVGDGHIARDKRGKWVVFDEPKNGRFREKYEKLIEKVFNRKPSGSRWRICLYSKQVAELFEKLGLDKKCLEKEVPAWVFSLPLNQRLAFIEGYVDADGERRLHRGGYSRHPRMRMRFDSPNRKLIEQLRLLCITCGLRVSKVMKNRGGKRRRESYSFYARQPRATEHNRPYIISKVKKIEYVGEKEVYDLTIEGEHNFIANGVVVHNSEANLSDWISVTEGGAFDDWLRFIYDAIPHGRTIRAIRLYAYCSVTPSTGYEPVVNIEKVCGLMV